MFKTIKSKIFVIAITVLAVISIVFAGYAYVFETNTKPLILDYYSRYIEVLKDEINNDIIKIENNSKDLALVGSLFYKTDKSIDLTKNVIQKIFYNYPDSLGGGIWFEPYLIDKSQKRFCLYAFRDKNGKVVIDEDFNSEKYDYLNQDWYKQIISQIKDRKKAIAWSLPYYEDQGSNTLMITAGSGIYDDNGNLIGISTVDWEINSIEEQIKNMNFLLKISPQSSFSSGKYIKHHFALFANQEAGYIIVSTDPYLDNKSLIGKKLNNIPWYTENLINDIFITYHGKMYVPYVKYFDNGMNLIFCIPRLEMFYSLAHTFRIMLTFLILLGILISVLLYLSLNKYIMKPINVLTDIAKKIGKGEEVKIKVEKPEEFAQLALTFDKMTRDIKTITKEKEKINSELSIARTIQASSVPNKFPAFPDKSEFDIFASMESAKEVGGDFYDFYFIDENNFMFLIADVSGKGVPAALFMMTAKTLINNMAQVGYSPKDLIQIINKKMCENNKQGFFVTMLSGIVNIKTGKLTMINCGHNKPLIKRINGNYEYLEIDSNTPLGIFEETDFEIYESQLQKGDIIFTYTDGITEAMNIDEEMYGEERLYNYLNSIKDVNDIEKILLNVKQNLKLYTNSAPQSDDITMLGFKYNGFNSSKENNKRNFNNLAILENYKPFYSWLHKALSEWNVNSDLSNTIDMCAEEIFANITFYAYPENKGNIKVLIEKTDKEIIMQFEDSGIAYNPLEKPDPDINMPLEQRPIGGLGIFMVKNMSKKVLYERFENKNILTLIFDN